jgi:hypothetical protein
MLTFEIDESGHESKINPIEVKRRKITKQKSKKKVKKHQLKKKKLNKPLKLSLISKTHNL